MSHLNNPIAEAVQKSVVNLLELVEKAAPELNPKEKEELRTEVHKTVLMFIAAIVLADHKYEAGEQAFLRVLVDWSQKPGGDVRYINEYAEQWKTAERQIPQFFKVAVQHDTRHQADIAKAMLREIKLIGNNASVSDGKFAAIEHVLIHRYLLFLEEYRLGNKSKT